MRQSPNCPFKIWEVVALLIIGWMLVDAALTLVDCFSDAPGCNNHLPGVL